MYKGHNFINTDKKLAVELNLFLKDKIQTDDNLTLSLMKEFNDFSDKRTDLTTRKLTKIQ